jgi:hypothetical protein
MWIYADAQCTKPFVAPLVCEIAGDSTDGTFGYILDVTDGLLSLMGTIEDAYPVNVERLDPELAIILLGARACRGPRGSHLRQRCWDRARGTGRIRISPEPG